MILHIATTSPIIDHFINLINDEFNGQEHRFWLSGSRKHCKVQQSASVYFCGHRFSERFKAYIKLILQLHLAQKVIIHGLFNIRVIAILAFCPWLLRKCYWLIWGGDLYSYQNPKRRFREKIKEALRRFVIKRVGHLVSYVPGDISLAREWYGACGKYHECLMYPSNVVNPELLQRVDQVTISHSGLNVLVGNSADPSNNHLEVLEILLPFKGENIRIYAPLSYGDQVYAEKVAERGRDLFGDKFVPLTKFMEFEKYIKFLKSVDIVIYNHKRQQAMGNTITLLGLGKTVFMRNDVSQWNLLKSLDLNVGNISDFNLQLFSSDKLIDNSKSIQSSFSKEKLILQLSNIFGS